MSYQQQFIFDLKNIFIFLQIYILLIMFINFIGAIGAPQVILVVIVVLLLFGGRKIPELMKGLGSGIKEFKKATKDEKETSDVKKKKE